MRIALPAIVSNLTVPLLGLCDTALTGHLGNPRYIAAIAVGSMMLSVLSWSLGFLRSGTTGMTAQCYGGGDDTGTRMMLRKSLVFALSAGALLIAMQYPLGRLLSMVIGAEGDVDGLAVSYFNICVWGAPAMLGTMAVSGWFLGMQDSRRPMLIAISTNVVNIAVSYLLVYPMGLGFIGTALGTLSANWFSLILGLWLVRKSRMIKGGERRVKSEENSCERVNGRVSFALLRYLSAIKISSLFDRRFFMVNGDIFLRSFCIMAVSLSVTSIGARCGAVTLAANAIVTQLFLLFSYFMDGFAFSAEALSGKYAGSKDWTSLRRLVRRLILLTSVLMSVFTLAYAFGYGLFAMLLAPEPMVIARISDFRVWIALIPICSFLAFIYDGFYIGLTATRRMLLVTMTAAGAFFGVDMLLPSSMVEDVADRMWIAFLCYLSLRSLLLPIFLPRRPIV